MEIRWNEQIQKFHVLFVNCTQSSSQIIRIVNGNIHIRSDTNLLLTIGTRPNSSVLRGSTSSSRSVDGFSRFHWINVKSNRVYPNAPTIWSNVIPLSIGVNNDDGLDTGVFFHSWDIISIDIFTAQSSNELTPLVSLCVYKDNKSYSTDAPKATKPNRTSCEIWPVIINVFIHQRKYILLTVW